MNRTLLALLLCVACGDRNKPAAPVPKPAAAVDVPSAPPAPQSYAPLQRESLYELALNVRSQTGAMQRLDTWRGHTVLVAMFYASCPAACPRLIDDVGRVLAALPEGVAANARVLMVSFDPARDTPAQLVATHQKYKLDERWLLASAEEAEARELAAVLGVKYRRLDNGEFYHTSVITALNENGVPLARVENGLQDPAGFVAALAAAPATP